MTYTTHPKTAPWTVWTAIPKLASEYRHAQCALACLDEFPGRMIRSLNGGWW